MTPVPGTFHDNFQRADPLPELGDWLDSAGARVSEDTILGQIRTVGSTRDISMAKPGTVFLMYHELALPNRASATASRDTRAMLYRPLTLRPHGSSQARRLARS